MLYINITLLYSCSSQNTFKFRDQFKKKAVGTEMGNTLSCSKAYIAMSKSDKSATEHSILTILPINLLRN